MKPLPLLSLPLRLPTGSRGLKETCFSRAASLNRNANLAGTGYVQRADSFIGSHKTEPFFPKIRVGKPMAHGSNPGPCVFV